MALTERIKDLYEEIRKKFQKSDIQLGRGNYPGVLVGAERLSSEFLDELVRSCGELYNQIDSVVQALKLTVPEVYDKNLSFIKAKVIGQLRTEQELVDFRAPAASYLAGDVEVPSSDKLPLGISRVIDLLVRAVEALESGHRVSSDEFYCTAKVSFGALRPALTRFLTRFGYVMMYPHRIVLDRMVLETGLKKHGMERVVGYVQSAEESFNHQKYVEFCAISRNALHEAVKNVCLIVDGVEKGFPNNCRRLKEIGFLRGTIIKQMKEFSGSLSAGGSHPPKGKMSDDEAKFLLESLYGFLGLVVLRLSSFRQKPKTK